MRLQDLKKYLSTTQVAEKYHLARQNVLLACKSGRFAEDEAVETVIGWLIEPKAAEKLWGDRIKDSI